MRLLAALRASVLLLFLPAHLAFVLLIDLNFIPVSGSTSALNRSEERGPDKERLRITLRRKTEARIASLDARQALVFRDLDPWSLAPRIPLESFAGRSVSVKLTKPAAIHLWLAATPHNHRAPPA